MKTIFLSLTLIVGSATLLSAQSINGKVLLTDGDDAAFSTVILYSAADTSLVKGAIADDHGGFAFEAIPAGRYYVHASMLGMGAADSPVFDYAGGDRILDKIQIQESSQTLQTVTITASKPIVEVQADKTILNVDGNINSQGQNVLELLRKAPGVVVDNNENVNMRGKNAVRIQIDGRDVPMQGRDLAAVLKTMRAEDILSIELISNPSAKYDASGNAGIINIRTKKKMALGANGSMGAELVYGESLKGGINSAFNYRNQHYNVFGNYNNHFGDWHNGMNLLREQNGQRFDMKSKMVDNNNMHNFKLGSDFFLNDKNTIGFLVDGRHNKGPWENSSRTPISMLDTPNNIDSVLIANNKIPQERNNFNFNVNYRYADTTGHELNVDLNRGIYRFRADSYQPNMYMDPTEQSVLSEKIYRNNTPTDVDMMIGKIDYEQKALKGKVGIGFKTAHVKTDNTFDFYDVIEGISVKNADQSNRFVYNEHVNAAYLNYNTEVKKWGFQGGIRAENTDYTGDLMAANSESDQHIENNYLNLFPSAAVTYKMNDKNQFSLTYSRRIDRPRYQDLNPFENRLDELTYQKGNPFLRPQFTNNVELTHTFMGFLNTTVGYSHTNDMFTEYIDTTEGSRAYQRKGNIADQDNYSLSLSFPMPITKWWDGYFSWSGYIARFNADFREGFAYTETFQSFNAYSEQTFKLGKGWSVQVSGWFNSPGIWGAVMRSKAQGAMDLGVRKQIMDGDGTISLAFGDILGTANWSGVNDFTPGLYMRAAGNWESQTVKLNVNYNFGNKSIKGARQRKTGLEDINQRLGK
ncbi:MAG: TonB-dependent receptor [Lewinellaceae bacterium]|nr:TonB-dependent receptor [Lewinellaceae bacterium]